MTASCVRCHAPLLPHIDACLACHVAKSTSLPPGASRRFRLIGPLKDPAKLAAVLARLSPSTPVSEIDWMMRRTTFDVSAELDSVEEKRLRAIMDACGARYFIESGADRSTGRRWKLDGRSATKLATAAAIGVAAFVWAVPVVPIAAGAMVGMLAMRAGAKVTCEIVIARAAAAELLGVVPSGVMDEARVAATSASDGTRDAFRTGFAAILDIAAYARGDAAHLTREAYAKLDAAVPRLARAFARLVGSSNVTRRFEATVREIEAIRDALLSSADAAAAEESMDGLTREMTAAIETLELAGRADDGRSGAVGLEIVGSGTPQVRRTEPGCTARALAASSLTSSVRSCRPPSRAPGHSCGPRRPYRRVRRALCGNQSRKH